MMRDQICRRGGIEGPCFGRQSIAGYIDEILSRYDFQEVGLCPSFRGRGLSGCLFDGLDVFLLFWR